MANKGVISDLKLRPNTRVQVNLERCDANKSSTSVVQPRSARDLKSANGEYVKLEEGLESVVINLNGLKERKIGQLEKIYSDIGFDVALLTETHHRQAQGKRGLKAEFLHSVFSDWSLFQIHCDCEEYIFGSVHGMLALLHPRLTASTVQVKLTKEYVSDHRQLYLIISTDNGETHHVITPHYKSGAEGGGVSGGAIKRLQMRASLNALRNVKQNEVAMIAGDFNVDPKWPIWGEVENLFHGNGFTIESHRQLWGTDSDNRPWTHSSKGQTKNFLDHSAVRLPDGFCCKVELLGPPNHLITTDHERFLKISIKKGVQIKTEYDKYGLRKKCKKCGRGSQTTIHKHYCPYVSRKNLIRRYKTVLLKNKNTLKPIKLTRGCKKKKSILICPKCSKIFRCRRSYEYHLNIHTETKPFSCKTCHKKFRNPKSCWEHQSIHTGRKGYSCRICQRAFRTWKGRWAHEFVHTEDRRFLCEKCGKSFKRRNTLSKHNMSHLGKMYTCRYCPKTFRLSWNCTHHEQNHSTEKNHICPTCNKGFNTKTKLFYHKKIHNKKDKIPKSLKTSKDPTTLIKKRGHVCDICQKGFCLPKELKRHRAIHFEERKFICRFCPKAFKSDTNRLGHEKTHNTEQSFICPTCNKGFYTKFNLNKHLKIHNEEDKIPKSLKTSKDPTTLIKKRGHVCDICQKGFCLPKELKRHRAIHFEERKFICRFCPKAFKSDTNRLGHEKTHNTEQSFICPTCNKTFNVKFNLNKHLKTHGEKTKICKTCGKGFIDNKGLRRHETVHTGERNFACGKCGKLFKTSPNLVEHMQTHRDTSDFPCPTCNKEFQSQKKLTLHMKTHLEFED